MSRYLDPACLALWFIAVILGIYTGVTMPAHKNMLSCSNHNPPHVVRNIRQADKMPECNSWHNITILTEE